MSLQIQISHLHETKPTTVRANWASEGCDPSVIHLDTLRIYNHRQRRAFCEQVSQVLKKNGQDLPPGQVETELLCELQAAEQNARKPEEAPADPLADTPEHIRQQAERLLRASDLVDRIYTDIEYIGVSGERETSIACYLVATSRLLDRPLAAVISGASASGKSHVLNTITKLMPPESVLQAHDITPASLYYLPPGSLQHRIVACGERVQRDGQAEEGAKALREGLSDGCLRKIVTTKDEKTGKLTASQIYQPGPWAYIETTTAQNIGDETATRMLLLNADESSDQTKRVMERLAKQAAGEFRRERIDAIVAVHHCFQRLLQRVIVVVPWAPLLELPKNKPATRRTYGQLLGLIQAIALLRQQQHNLVERDDRLCVMADATDYAIARELALSVFRRSYDVLPSQSRLLLGELQSHFPAPAVFTVADIREKFDVMERTIHRRLKPLVDSGGVTRLSERRPFQFQLTGISPSQPDLNLPPVEAVEEQVCMHDSPL